MGRAPAGSRGLCGANVHTGSSALLTADDFVGEYKDFMSLATVEYIPPAISVERHCDCCGEGCESECMCGEIFCSRACMKKEWKNHREMCETVFDNGTVPAMMTQNESQMEMRENLSPDEFKAALGGDSDRHTEPSQDAGPAAGKAKGGKKVKPNEPCPCGTGKKYKTCCGAN